MSRFPSVALACVILFAHARADVIAIPAARDNTLWNDPTGGTSNGSGGELIVGKAGGMSSFPIRRGLIAFDVASWVPAGATINSARLELVRTSGNNVPRTVELHRVLASWGEGASNATSGQGAPSQPGDATWIHRAYPTTAWTMPGGDFAAAASATQVVNGPGVHAWGSNATLTAEVQAWLDAPASSHGWLLRDADEAPSQTTQVFGTRENTDPALRPVLVVEFTPPTGVFTFCPAKPNGLGCTPAIAWNGTPSASAATGFDVELAYALNEKSGVLAYSLLGPGATPFHGGTLCVQTPARRSPSLFSGGNGGAPDCSGAFSFDFNARIASGVDPALASGAIVWCQYLSRDPIDGSGFSLSAALRFEIGP